MKEYVQHEFELDRNESLVIGADGKITVTNLIISKEVVDTVRSVTQLAPDIVVTTTVERTVPIARVGLGTPKTMAIHRGEVFNFILGNDAEQLLPLFQAVGATKEDCMAAVRQAARDMDAAKALLEERFGPPVQPPTA